MELTRDAVEHVARRTGPDMSGLVGRALRAEWTKLRSVRSTTWTAIAVVGLTVGVSAFLAAVGGTNANEAGARGDDDVVVNGLRGVWLGQVAMVALGADRGDVRVRHGHDPSDVHRPASPLGHLRRQGHGRGGRRPRGRLGGERVLLPRSPSRCCTRVASSRRRIRSSRSTSLRDPRRRRHGAVPHAARPVRGRRRRDRAACGGAMTLVVGLVLVPTVVMEFFSGTPARCSSRWPRRRGSRFRSQASGTTPRRSGHGAGSVSPPRGPSSPCSPLHGRSAAAMSAARAFTRAVRAEWTKLRSVPSTPWLLPPWSARRSRSACCCSAVDTAGGTQGCVPGGPGCGDEDVVLNSLAGVYMGQLAVIALGVLAATSEYTTGTIRDIRRDPTANNVVLVKTAVLAAPVLTAGLTGAHGSFLLGQPILHTNGFVPSNGYPFVALADPAASRPSSAPRCTSGRSPSSASRSAR